MSGRIGTTGIGELDTRGEGFQSLAATGAARRRRRLLTPEEQWEIFLEVTSRELSQADTARKWGVDVSVVVRLRAVARDAALAAFASSGLGRPASAEQRELELLRAENDQLWQALKEMAMELTLYR
jgi:transposase-like protein